MTTEFNFPKNAFGYIAGAVPAKMVFLEEAPLNPVEGLWWVKLGTDPLEVRLYAEGAWHLSGSGGGGTPETPVEIVRSSVTYLELAATDNKKHYLFLSDSNVDVVLPLAAFNAASPFMLFISQFGLGLVTVSGAAGVTVRCPEDMLSRPAGRYATIGAELVGNNEWLLVGNLGA
ncbi:MAG: hypothetical protein [Siphoviridae sp. ct7UA22]|nr:MAG: hypothetical protein [Siphoviridae sp. ct7UA22]